MANNIHRLKKNDDLDLLISHIGERRQSLLQKFKSGENLDGAAFDLTAALLSAIVQALPELEKGLRTSPRGVYPFVNLTTVTRELLHDLRMMQDRSALKNAIVAEIVEPQLTSYATSLNSMLNMVRKSDPSTAELMGKVKNMSRDAINTMHREISVRLDKYLEGTGDIPAKLLEDIVNKEDDIFMRGPVRNKVKKTSK